LRELFSAVEVSAVADYNLFSVVGPSLSSLYGGPAAGIRVLVTIRRIEQHLSSSLTAAPKGFAECEQPPSLGGRDRNPLGQFATKDVILDFKNCTWRAKSFSVDLARSKRTASWPPWPSRCSKTERRVILPAFQRLVSKVTLPAARAVQIIKATSEES